MNKSWKSLQQSKAIQLTFLGVFAFIVGMFLYAVVAG